MDSDKEIEKIQKLEKLKENKAKAGKMSTLQEMMDFNKEMEQDMKIEERMKTIGT